MFGRSACCPALTPLPCPQDDLAFQQKKKEEAAALKALKEKAGAKGGFAKVKGSK